jgi:hypothetical protein
MADNIQVSQGIGTTMATDDVAGVQYPRVKVSVGLDGSATDVSSSNPMPVSGPLTDAQLRATVVPVSVSGVATAANQATGNSSLSSIDGKIPAQVGGKVPVDIGAPSVSVSNFPATQPVSGPLTDTQLRNAPVPVSVSGVATAANQTTANSSLSSIDTKTPALDNAKQPVVPSMTTGGHLSVQTATTGTNWTAYSSQTLKQLTISNQTGVTIEFRQGGTGVGFQIPTGAFYTFFGIANANQIEARRVDVNNTQVAITARWES